MTPNSGDEYDPFAELDAQQEMYARPRKLDALEKGKVYKVVNVYQKQSDYKDAKSGKFPLNTIVHYYDAGLKFTSILPKCFNDKLVKWVEAMNKLISKNMNPKLVYYGKVGMGYEVELLRHTQEPNHDRLAALKLIEGSNENVNNNKRQSSSSSYDESPKKLKSVE